MHGSCLVVTFKQVHGIEHLICISQRESKRVRERESERESERVKQSQTESKRTHFLETETEIQRRD